MIHCDFNVDDHCQSFGSLLVLLLFWLYSLWDVRVFGVGFVGRDLVSYLGGFCLTVWFLWEINILWVWDFRSRVKFVKCCVGVNMNNEEYFFRCTI